MPPAHRHSPSARADQRAGRSGGTGGRGWFIALTVAVIAVVAVGVVVVVHGGPGRAAASPTTTPVKAVDASSSSGPLRVVATTPVNGETQVPTDATLSVQFSEPLSAHSPAPTLSPAVAGSWQEVTPTTYTFVATAPLVPSSTETVTIPGGPTGMASADGKRLPASSTVQFTVEDGSTLRLQQLLAQLGYLPVSFIPAGPLTAPQEAAQPQQGTFAWRFTEPAALTAQWTVGSANQITKGAVMTFESQHNLTTDGVAGPAVWTQLLAAAEAGAMDPAPYNYVYVSQNLPETATVYSNGTEVYSTRANTPGTYPVYLRYKVTTMRGTNPDGSKYVDPGIPWVSYFNGGDALHGFVRASYGFPQSDGCVEMPPSHAEAVFPYTPIGTLVTVAAA
jgi:peptidoglycan hydrolase-like protein with peptidoglycan-binding domain